ncbi:uncharacterized protein LOC121378842 [Gigantopelta aegis]|uniref:uncharacterized protein LOC121378842 n=1 Tax=Gigantopelta aegis TaxID=1735272 RepID=UPI001B8890EE|nr:uncharacterized protein LOC121378842 [Gigantopelta aegis]
MTDSSIFKCFKDICDEGIHYCDTETERCYKCEDIKDGCNSTNGDFPSQCTRFCIDYLMNLNPADGCDSYQVPFFITLGLLIVASVLLLIVTVKFIRTRRCTKQVKINATNDEEAQKLINQDTPTDYKISEEDSRNIARNSENNTPRREEADVKIECETPAVERPDGKSNSINHKAHAGDDDRNLKTDSSYTEKKHCEPQIEVDSIVREPNISHSENGNGGSPKSKLKACQETINNDQPVHVDGKSGCVNSQTHSIGIYHPGMETRNGSVYLNLTINNSNQTDGGLPEKGSKIPEQDNRKCIKHDLHNKLNTINPSQDKEGKHAPIVC